MTILKAEKRDMSVKAKALRKQGMVTGNVYGREMPETISIQLSALDMSRFMKQHSKGSQATLELGDEKIKVLLKDISFEPLTNRCCNVDFQALVEGEKVTNTTPIVLLNTDNITGFLTHNLDEVTYKAVPADLVETIEIDVSKLAIGTSILVGDLDLAKNENIELITPLDTSVLHIAEHQKRVAEDTEETDAAAVPVMEAEA